MKRVLVLTYLVVALSAAAAEPQDIKVVIVANRDVREDVSLLLVRKAFLGIPARTDGVTLKAIRNTSDARLNAVFLQTVVAMSEHSYDRRLLTATLQRGVPLPAEIAQPDELVRTVERTPGALSYMWYRDAKRHPALRIVRVIWQSD